MAADAFSKEDITAWMDKTHLLLVYTDRCYYRFFKSGFTEAVKDFANGCERLTLVDLEQLFTI